MVYCGQNLQDDGTIGPLVWPENCLAPSGGGVLPALAKAGVHPELWVGGGNNSIYAARALWKEPTNSIAELSVFVKEAKVLKGVNIDIEPQTPGNAGNVTDAEHYAAWLTTLGTSLHLQNVRLTAAVADFSPVLHQFPLLANATDRIFTMSTYNAYSLEAWMLGYRAFLANSTSKPITPLDKAGIGLGGWMDRKWQGRWSTTLASAQQRVAQMVEDGVKEIAVFPIMPSNCSLIIPHSPEVGPCPEW
jgi:hypothetical protein